MHINYRRALGCLNVFRSQPACARMELVFINQQFRSPGLRDFSLKFSEAHKKVYSTTSLFAPWHSPKKSTDGSSILVWELPNSTPFPATTSLHHFIISLLGVWLGHKCLGLCVAFVCDGIQVTVASAGTGTLQSHEAST